MSSEDRRIKQIKAGYEKKISDLKKLISISRDFTSESLIKRADTAFYQARDQGRNQVVLAE